MSRTSWALLAAASVVCAPPSAWATGQTPDAIEIDGKEFYLNTNPLEPYLAAHPDRRPKGETVSSGLWRGYKAHWQIANGQLRLLKIEVLAYRRSSNEYAMTDVTAKYFPQVPTIAEWYSGALIVPNGKIVNYVHMGYASTYESYVVIVVKSGTVAKRDDLSFDQFEKYRRRKFEEFKSTKAYAERFRQTAQELKDEAMAEEFLFEICAEQYLSNIDN